jgi:glycosyltransferase involved in cell wall biosynthesis
LFKQKHDIYLFANVGSGWHCLLVRLFGKRVILNVDGLDWVRGKWGRIARTYFRSAAHAGLFACDALVTDADAMVDFYVKEFNRKLEMIAYGAYIENSKEPSLIKKFDVEPNGYYLIASRLVPENHADLIIEAFKGVQTDRKLIIAGDANYDSPFHQKIRNSGDHRIRFTGWIDNQSEIKELHCNAYAYLHGHSVGGTNPALLKALGYSNMILALNTPFNAEVLDNGKYGILFEKDVEDLRSKIEFVEHNPDEIEEYRHLGPERIQEKYDWDDISDQYLELMQGVNNGRSDSSTNIRKIQIGIMAIIILLILLIVFS